MFHNPAGKVILQNSYGYPMLQIAVYTLAVNVPHRVKSTFIFGSCRVLFTRESIGAPSWRLVSPSRKISVHNLAAVAFSRRG